MTPRLESVWFDNSTHQYPRLARVLEHTARRHCPTWDVRVREVPPTGVRAATGSSSHADNSWKLGHWVRAAEDAPDGMLLVLVDADTFVTRPLDALEETEFDLAYTRRERTRFPLNGGVFALRVSDLTRRFMRAWLAQDRWFLENAEEHRPWHHRYGGMNQASLGYMLTVTSAFPDQAKVAALPCLEWNCEDTEWERFDPDVTRIVHVKSALRMAIFGIGPRRPGIRRLARLWKDLEREAVAA